MFDLQQSIKQHYPKVSPKLEKFQFVFKALEKLLHLEDINTFIDENKHLKNFAFLDAILKHFDFHYKISNNDLQKIPAEGRVIIVTNHPVGSLDGLALLRMIYDIRPDVKIVATPLLTAIKPLQDLFLPIDNISKKAHHKQNLNNIYQALNQEQAIIIFPAGEVSRITPKGVKDGHWKIGFLRMAETTQSPILPVHVDCRNSIGFYTASTLYKPLGTMMLIHEMFKQKSNTIEFKTGYPVDMKAWQMTGLKKKDLAARFRKHLFGLRKNKSQFNTTATIAHPIQARRLHSEIKQLDKIGSTHDGMNIYLMPYKPDSLLMQEIGRLRELAFRMVNEGTGKQVDLDEFDTRYQHLILWNEKELEIVGSYRIGLCGQIIREHGLNGLYTSTLYQINPEFIEVAEQTLELGRSFVQPKYWGLRGLEYLWYGIGAVIRQHPQIKYLFGAVSIPGDYPQDLLHDIVSHYASHYQKPLSAPNMIPYHPFQYQIKPSAAERKTAFNILLRRIKNAGVKLPVLYKQYTDLCENGGVGFINFATDPHFNGCVDGLIWLELEKMKTNKKAKYIQKQNFNVEKDTPTINPAI